MLGWSPILSAAGRIHPGSGLEVLKDRAMLLCRLARARPWLSRWLDQRPNAMLRQRIEREPELLGFVVWPYIHARWPVHRRFAALSEHLRLVDRLFPWLSLGQGDRLALSPLDGLTPGLRLELDRAPWFVREGALVFNVFLQDHRLMSVAFSLGLEQDELIARVGGLQGSNRKEALAVYRRLTKTLHGLRPRDFAVKAFQLFAGSMGVAKILCVADEHRHHRHSYFGNGGGRALSLDYDQVWQEHGGRRRASGFFELAVAPAAKRIEEVPSRKRAMYRRRHGMLAEVERALRGQLPRSPTRREQSPGDPLGEPLRPPPDADAVRGGALAE